MITYLKDEAGTLVWKHNEKENIVYQHFLGVLSSKINRRHTLDWDNLGLSRIDDHELDRPFTLEELKHTVDEFRQKRLQGQMASLGCSIRDAGILSRWMYLQ